MNLLIITEQEARGTLLQDHLQRVLFSELPRCSRRTAEECIHSLVFPVLPKNPSEGFRAIESSIAELASDGDLIAVVDRIEICDSQKKWTLNPLWKDRSAQGIEPLVATLVLAFPEVRWLFGTIRGSLTSDQSGYPLDRNLEIQRFRKAHGLHNLFHQSGPALFDGSGLRDCIRARIREDNTTADEAAHLPRRLQNAAGFDEEVDYANLHAYTAYRFGLRAHALTTKAQADCILGRNKKTDKMAVVFEDLFLNLPDGTGGYSWLGKEENDESKFEKCPRHKSFPRLETVGHRIIVTSGQQMHRQREKHAITKQYIAQERAAGKFIQELRKPHAGILSIWRRAGLHEKLIWVDEHGTPHRGTGKGYIWPPPWKLIERSQSSESGGHSAPGILLVIAKHLLDRADGILKNDTSLEADLRGAVFATDALELLGGKTPTLSAQALALKNLLEVRAVCHFAGVEHHIKMEPRWREIQRDAKAIARWYHPKDQKRAELNIQMDIANKLVKLLRDENQFDEEQFWMHRARRIHNTLWMREYKIRFGFWPLLRYGEFLLSSLPKFGIAVAAWIAGFAGIFALVEKYCGEHTSNSAIGPVSQALFTFLAGEPPNFNHDIWIFISSLAAVIGIAHLGVFISHLYSIVSRR